MRVVKIGRPRPDSGSARWLRDVPYLCIVDVPADPACRRAARLNMLGRPAGAKRQGLHMTQKTTKGLDLGFIHDLTDAQRSALAKVVARAAEKSYRRGFQQGAQIGGDQLKLHDWRYLRSLDKSPTPDQRGPARSPVDILFQESPDLGRLLDG